MGKHNSDGGGFARYIYLGVVVAVAFIILAVVLR